jgi:signal transduction histidine kinase
MIEKLRRRFIIIAVLSISLVMILLIGSVNIINFLSAEHDIDNMLEMLADNSGFFPDFLNSPDQGGKFNGGRDTHFTPETQYTTRFFTLHYEEDGTLVNADMRHIAAVTEDDVGIYLDAALKKGSGFGYLHSYRYYVTADPLGSRIAVFLDCTSQLRSIRIFFFVSLLAMVCCVGLTYLLIVILSRRALSPVIEGIERQKQFITDASHELKTPLTVIATSLKVLEMESGQTKWIDKALSQVDKMRDLVNQMVTLSRLDEEKPPLAITDFDLSNAVSETAESFSDFAEANSHTLALAIAPDLTYHGDEYAVRQLVSILLDNAVKYASEGSAITLSLERARKGFVLRVSNPCSEIDTSKLDKLFDRFYRADASRSTGGFGIGLSIARSIAEAHHGTIKAHCPREGVIEFVAKLR